MLGIVEVYIQFKHTTPHAAIERAIHHTQSEIRGTTRSGIVSSQMLPATPSWVHHVFALVNPPVSFITPAAPKDAGDVNYIASPVRINSSPVVNVASPAIFIAGVIKYPCNSHYIPCNFYCRGIAE
jgi:hypothetical protein